MSSKSVPLAQNVKLSAWLKTSTWKHETEVKYYHRCELDFTGSNLKECSQNAIQQSNHQSKHKF